MIIKRILLGPSEVAGYFSRLKAGFDELGIPCEHLLLTPNKFNYQESDYFMRSSYLKVEKLRFSSNMMLKFIGLLLESTIRLLAMFYAILRFDVFIMPGFGSFFKFYELPLLKFLGKKIIIVYLGSDARPSYLSGKHLDNGNFALSYESIKKEAVTQSKLISKVEKYADIIINHTATAQYFTRSFVRLNALGIPILQKEGELHKVNKKLGITRILHAPSRPLAKGSLVFKKAINELRYEGYEIDFIELVGVSNAVVLKELENCDFVVDEMYSDVPMAMLATEAAANSKPVVVAGYYAKQYTLDNPSKKNPPALYVMPSEIKEAIRKLIDDIEYRLALGEKAYQFVSQFWSAEKVAKNYLQLIEDDIPDCWWGKPSALSYYWGWGLSKEHWLQQVGGYVSKYGREALLLNHNPALLDSILLEIQQGERTLNP